MERYVDGFLIPIPKANLDRYLEMARQAGAVWMEHGALEYYECLGDDLEKAGMTSFITSAGAKADELVVFSWIVYESREQRNRVNAAVMADPRIKTMMESGMEPFEMGRMAYGGFKTLVALEAD
jgi:uncharacterized protein YbaA (DUF1428 family)